MTTIFRKIVSMATTNLLSMVLTRSTSAFQFVTDTDNGTPLVVHAELSKRLHTSPASAYAQLHIS